MSSIVTITTNPCIDISAAIPKVQPEKKLYCDRMRKDPGGGGINVCRVLKRLGIDAVAVYVAGGYTGDNFTAMMRQEQVSHIVIPISQDTRENFIVTETASNTQYRFGMPGPVVQEQEWQMLIDSVSAMKDVDFLVISGSLGNGYPEDFYSRLIKASPDGCRVVVDTAGKSLLDALQAGVFMVKPNMGELAAMAGKEKLTVDDATLAARQLIAKMQSEIVVVSMGADGALMVTADDAYIVKAPTVEQKSTVGAGDSMVAGIVYALHQNETLHHALMFGVACGTATTMHEGTGLAHVSDVNKLYEQLLQSNPI